MKRQSILVLSLAATLVLLVSACGGESEEPPAATGDQASPTAEPEAGDEPTEEPEQDEESSPDEVADSDYFDGETITWIVSSSPGGGGDNLARAYAPYLVKHLPGEPRVVFEYLSGGGGVEAVNHIANVADKDGRTIATATQDSFISQVLGQEGVQYDFRDLNFLGNFTDDDQMLIVRSDVGASTFEELLELGRPIKSGARSASHPVARVPLVLEAIFEDVDLFDMTYGYEGGAEITLDIERGTLEGRSNSVGALLSSQPEWVEDEFIVPLVFVGRERHPEFPDVPTIYEVTPPGREHLLELIFAPEKVSRSLVTTPDAPEEAMQLLEAAFEAMAEDPGMAEAVAELGFLFGFVSGQEILETVETVIADDEMVQSFDDLLNQ